MIDWNKMIKFDFNGDFIIVNRIDIVKLINKNNLIMIFSVYILSKILILEINDNIILYLYWNYFK